MSRILFLVNHDVVIYNFRLELVERLLNDGHHVIISSPYGERIDKLIELGCEYKPIEIARHGMNPLKECVLIGKYLSLLKETKPDVVLSYTVKANIYGGIACTIKKVPYISNITGLGTAIENGGIIQKILCFLYRIGLKKAHKIFFQNEHNKSFFKKRNIYVNKHELTSGSGVNLDKFSYMNFPEDSGITRFLFISRIMKDKGADEFFSATKRIKTKYPEAEFHVCGFCEEEYESTLKTALEENSVAYHGMVSDVREYINQAHCIVLPSYHEGMANVLLEAAACGRPVIATDIPGCRETFDEGVSGLGCQVRSVDSLEEAMETFINLPYDKKIAMGKEGRKKMENCFNRQIVVEAYIKEINEILKTNKGDFQNVII